MEKLTLQQRHDMALVMCGVFARSNMGMERPPREDVQRSRKNPPTSPESSAYLWCEHLMEDDYSEKAFCDEAKMWFKNLKKTPVARLRDIHPDLMSLYDSDGTEAT